MILYCLVQLGRLCFGFILKLEALISFQIQDGGGRGKQAGQSKFSGGSFYTSVSPSYLCAWGDDVSGIAS